MRITRTEVIVLADPPAPGPVDLQVAGDAYLRIYTDEGIVGLSEVFAVPPGVAKAVLEGPDSLFGRLLVGEDPIPPERLWARLYNSILHGNRRGWAVICIGAADVALWDIYGKAMNRPTYQLLGGAERSSDQTWSQGQYQEVVPYCTMWASDMSREGLIREQMEKVVKVRDMGFRAVKVEPCCSSPETVVDLARLARQELGPGRTLCVDVGYLWNDVGLALQVIDQLSELDIFFLETPFPVDSLEAYARLTAKTKVRIAAGEHTVSRWEFLDLMDRGGVQVVQPYATTVGGLTEARRVVELAMPRGAIVCPGNWGSQVLGAANVQLAAFSPITPFIEYAPAQVYWSPLRKAILEEGLPVVDGAISLPTRPGNGIELSESLVKHFRVG